MSYGIPNPQGAALAAFIRARRHELGISQGTVADRYGSRVSYIQHLEAGWYTPTVSSLCKLAIALECSMIDLLKALGYDPEEVTRRAS